MTSDRPSGLQCNCSDNGNNDPDWEAPLWSDNPDALGCPKHKPYKQYCRIHHNGFYGDCHPCQWGIIAQALTDLTAEPEMAPVMENQSVQELVAKLADELS